jgi:DNA-binding response OmpR family regulator
MTNLHDQSLNVLVVDDSLAAREWAAHCFDGKPRVQVDLAASADDGLSKAGESALGLLLLDYKLGGTERAGLIQRYRDRAPAAVILALIADGHRGECLSALRDGADHFVLKPLTWEKVRRAIEAVYRLRGNIKEDEALPCSDSPREQRMESA